MRGVFEVGDTKPKPGEIAKGTLGSVEISDGTKATTALININGAEDGPVLTVVGGVHGYELSPIGALLAVAKSIDPRKLRGAFLGIPIGNPLAVRDGVYTTPTDGLNLSGPWYLPAKDQSTAYITQRMAYQINKALEPADYVLDMHANPYPSMPFVILNYEMCKDEKTKAETKRIAEAYGVTVINNPRKVASSMRDICGSHGKPSLTPELAGNRYMFDSIIDVGKKGILNVMKAIGMLEGEPEQQDVKVIPGDLLARGQLCCQRGGFMYVVKEPGEPASKGETVVEITDVYGDIVDEVKMPIDGYCWSFTGGANGVHAVSEGQRVAYIFTERSNVPDEQIFVEKA